MRRKSTLPIKAHEAVTETMLNFYDSIEKHFNGDFSISGFNLLLYIPRYQGYFHILPFRPHKDDIVLPGTSSPFFRLISNYPPKYLSENELNLIIDIAYSAPYVKDAIRDFTFQIKKLPQGELENQLKKYFLSIDDYRHVHLMLLKAFNENKSEVFDALKLTNSILLQSMVHIALLSIPQLDNTPLAYLSSGMDPYFCKTFEEKITQLTKLAENFEKLNSNLPFRQRLFLLLSLVESLQWKENSSFAVIGKPSVFLQDRRRNTALLDICDLTGLMAYFYSSNEPDEFQKDEIKNQFADVLMEQLDLCVEITMRMVLSRYKTDILRFPMLHGRPSFSVVYGLLNLFRTKWMAIGSRDETNENQFDTERISMFECLDLKDIEKEGSLPERLLDQWSVYAKIDKIPSELSSIDLSGDEVSYQNRLLIIRKLPIAGGETIVMSLSPSSGNTLFQNNSSKIELGKLLADLCELNQYMMITGGEHDPWYETSFGQLYELFDKERQKSDAFKYRIDGEIPFLIKRIDSLEITGRCKLLDYGIGYGRVAQKLFEIKEDLHITGIDFSTILSQSAKQTFLNDERVHLINSDFRSLDNADLRDKFDIVTFMFTTFGCYNNEREDVKTLLTAFECLRPGGMLIVEQYNPVKSIGPYKIDHDKIPINNKGDFYYLWKTSTIEEVGGIHKYYGNYLYCMGNQVNQKPFRCDSYCLSLYSESWFSEQAKQLNASEFYVYGSFNEDDYQPQSSDLMIVIMKKPIDHKTETILTKQDEETAKKWLDKVAGLIKSFDTRKTDWNASMFKISEENIIQVIKNNFHIEFKCFLEEDASRDVYFKYRDKLKNKWSNK